MSTVRAPISSKVSGISGQRLVGVNEIAEYLGVSPGFIYKHKSQIPHIKVGRYLRFDVQQVRASLERSNCSGGE